LMTVENHRCFGLWPKYGYLFWLFKEDYYA
jgi:hypothetical protein